MPGLKPVVWIGPAKADLSAFPEEVKDSIGFALYLAQQGGKHRDAKPRYSEDLPRFFAYAHKVAARYNVSSLPTLIIFRDGEELARSVGVKSEADLREALDSMS